MKSLIFILCFWLMPFSVSANSYEKDSALSAKMNEIESLLWAELTLKEALLSAILALDKTNEALGIDTDIFGTPPKPTLVLPALVGVVALTFGTAEAAEWHLKRLPSGEELKKFQVEFKQFQEEYKKAALYEHRIPFYRNRIDTHSLHGSDFAKQIQAFSIEELSETSEERLRKMHDLKEHSKNNQEKISIKEFNKRMSQMELERNYVVLKQALLEYEEGLNKLKIENTLLRIIGNNKFGFFYRSGAALRQAGTRAFPWAGMIVFSFITMDIMYIAGMNQEQVTHGKERLIEDIAHLKRLLLPPLTP